MTPSGARGEDAPGSAAEPPGRGPGSPLQLALILQHTVQNKDKNKGLRSFLDVQRASCFSARLVFEKAVYTSSRTKSTDHRALKMHFKLWDKPNKLLQLAFLNSFLSWFLFML